MARSRSLIPPVFRRSELEASNDARYAHTLEGAGHDRWQTTEEHLDGVARLAGERASAFGSRDRGELAGYRHDLGKYAGDFQS